MRTTSSGPTPPKTNTIAVSGIDATMSRKAQARALKSLPRTIDSDEIGVVTSKSRVCFSRSRLIAPAVNAGARTSTRSVWRRSNPAKIPVPIWDD
jgi:hypothetical protein